MSLTLLVDDNGHHISQSFAQPNVTRGFVLDDPDTGGRSDTQAVTSSPEDSESSAPGMHFQNILKVVGAANAYFHDF